MLLYRLTFVESFFGPESSHTTRLLTPLLKPEVQLPNSFSYVGNNLPDCVGNMNSLHHNVIVIQVSGSQPFQKNNDYI